MRIFRYLLILLIGIGSLNAQILEPVKVSHKATRLNDTEVLLEVTATMDEGWHLYSVEKKEGSFVIFTELNVAENPNFKLIGGVEEPTPHEEYDPNFEEILKYHEKKVTFSQKIKLLNNKDFTAEVEFIYQTCNEETCLTPEYLDLEFKIKAVANSSAEGQIEGSSQTEEDGEKEHIDYAYNGEDTTTYENSQSESSEDNDDVEENTEPVVPESKDKSLLGIFLFGFLGGFAALLTPCVFPMIPLTVSFFTKQSKTRAKGISNAIIYGISIIAFYTLIGYGVTAIFGSDALNQFSTNPWVNIAFFVLLVVFAISFFGAFEITLPSSWVNKTDQASDKGGLVGIFFMAFTLALVSFSCTGPIIGTLLFEASTGGVQGPLVGMFGFSLALALPFALFAAFPGWLNSMPKSGGWLNSVKVVLGFIELAFAFKFLSTADLVWQAGLLQREWFIAIWIAIFALLTLYLLGKFKMPHDSPMDKLSVPRLFMAILSLFFVIYLIPGMWGAPLKLISGFPPPSFYSESPNGFGGSATSGGSDAHSSDVPEGSHPETCPLHLNCFHDFEAGKAYAKKVGKPILIDFTGWGCVNCRKMEEQVWSDPGVLSMLQNDVVLVSLYVDDREELPAKEQYVSEVTGKKIKTIGNKWSEFQIKHYQNNSQPQYILLDHKSMKPLNGSTAYDPDIPFYVNWLKEGIQLFEDKN